MSTEVKTLYEALKQIDHYLPFDWAFDADPKYVSNDPFREAVRNVRAALEVVTVDAQGSVDSPRVIPPLPDSRPHNSIGEALRELIEAADASDKLVVDQSTELQQLRWKVTQFREHLDFWGDPGTLRSVFTPSAHPDDLVIHASRIESALNDNDNVTVPLHREFLQQIAVIIREFASQSSVGSTL
jgi:hypothetical protein